jgi:Fic family protein
MNAADFHPGFPGRLVPTLKGYPAFVPNPLPPKIGVGWSTIALLEEARATLGRLEGAGKQLSNPHLLIRPFVQREAIFSSWIEGTYATAEQLALFDLEPGSAAEAAPDSREVSNYVRALEHGLKRLRDLPVCSRLMTEMHAILLQDVRGNRDRPGEFRDIQNLIGKPGEPENNARFVPPPVDEMREMIGQLERYVSRPHEERHWSPLIDIALTHYQFETIHPFRDGNGRVGRLLIALMLCERGLLVRPLLYLSAYLERNRDAYMNHLLAISQRGEWVAWVEFFLRGVIEEGRDALGRVDALIQLRIDYRRRLQTSRTSALVLDMVDRLFESPALSVAQTARRLNVTHRAAQLNVDKLVEAGVLELLPGRTRNRVYMARGVLAVVELDVGKVSLSQPETPDPRT